ncbi:MAG: restriction endonuclease subunit S [Kofleriaceae bacterium]|nr:restriction endonuclease subunit S [Kofleriaceae bacterium]
MVAEDGEFCDGDWIESKDQDPLGEIRLLQLADIGDGTFLDRSNRYVNQATFERLRCTEALEGDVLIARMPDPLGRACQMPGQPSRCITVVDVAILRPGSSSVDPRWLTHCINSPAIRRSIQLLASGTTRQRISRGNLAQIDIPIPPKHEQRRIVAAVDNLQAYRRRARESLEAVPPLLDKLRQSILAAAFRGDLTADWRAKNPDVEPADQLLARTPPPTGKSTGRDAAITVRQGRAAIGVGAQDRKLPSGWAWVDISRVAKLESGHTPSRAHSDYWDGGVPWIGIKDAREHHGQTIVTTFQTVSQLGLENSAARLLPAGTVCLSRTASVGYVTMMGRPMATSQDFANWICTPALLPEYLMFALLAEGDHLLTFGEGSTHTTIYYPALKALQLALPPLAEQAAVVASVKSKLSAVTRLEVVAIELNERADQLDPAILAKAFRGELVPQDPNDEPASVLLERIRAARAETPPPRRGRTTVTDDAPAPSSPAPRVPRPRAPAAPPPTLAAAEPGPTYQPRATPAAPLAAADLVDRVAPALWRRGPLDKDDAIRAVADHLRAAGQVDFQRLRSDGPLYTQLAAALDLAVKAGHLDRPRRGTVRACRPDPADYTPDDWRAALLAVLTPTPTDRDHALRAAADWARDTCGLAFERLRSDGHILTALRSALNSAIRRGEVVRHGADRLARAPAPPTEGQLSFADLSPNDRGEPR